jgi:hypothetical protein
MSDSLIGIILGSIFLGIPCIFFIIVSPIVNWWYKKQKKEDRYIKKGIKKYE